MSETGPLWEGRTEGRSFTTVVEGLIDIRDQGSRQSRLHSGFQETDLQGHQQTEGAGGGEWLQPRGTSVDCVLAASLGTSLKDPATEPQVARAGGAGGVGGHPGGPCCPGSPVKTHFRVTRDTKQLRRSVRGERGFKRKWGDTQWRQ